MFGRNKPAAPRPETPKKAHCSFCRKSQGVVAKLISNPSEYERVYICDECIAVCNSIVEDERDERARKVRRLQSGFVDPELVRALDRWLSKELSGADAAYELTALRQAATHILRPDLDE
jgi:hypothetical protein